MFDPKYIPVTFKWVTEMAKDSTYHEEHNFFMDGYIKFHEESAVGRELRSLFLNYNGTDYGVLIKKSKTDCRLYLSEFFIEYAKLAAL